MTYPTNVRYWVDEAIQSLEYLKPEAAQKIALMIEQNPTQHPQAIATNYRKKGEQLATKEKNRLGMRANSFMSNAALADLTDKGLAAPLAAHKQTILRASLAHGRAARLAQEQALGVTQWECVTAFNGDCPGCARMDGQIFSAEDMLPTGPQDCFREACAITYIAKMDFDAVPMKPQKQTARPWWKLW